MRVIAAIPACGLLAGCALGLAWPALPESVLFACLGAAFVAGCVAIGRRASALVAVAVALGAVSAGAVLAQHAWERAWRSTLRLVFESIAHDERQTLLRRGLSPPEDGRASVVLVGRLQDDAALTDGGGVSLRVHVTWIGRAATGARDAAANPVNGDATLTVAGDLATTRLHEWRRGRTVRVSAQLRRPTRYLDPGVVDQERALARRGVSLVGSVKSAALVDVVERGSVANEWAAALRAFSRRAIDDGVGRWSARAAAIVTAIVIGDRTGLDAEVQRRLQEAGTYHVIAISGGNIAILAGLTLTMFRLAGFLGPVAMVTAMGGLLAYGSVVSGGASVDRATWMAVVYFAGRALDLRGPPLNALALVAGILVARDPLAVVDPAFLLTFGASAAIVVASQVDAAPRSAVVRSIVALGLASLAAEVALFPVSASLFSRVTFAGLALNFVAIPMMAVAQVAGMLVVPVYAASVPAAAALGSIAAVGAEVLVRSASLVEWMPAVTWRLAAPSLAAVAVYYAALASWWTAARGTASRSRPRHEITKARNASTSAQVVRTRESRFLRWMRTVPLLVAGVTAVWILAEPWTLWTARGDGRLHITFIDVGQGDAALVRFPRGERMLIDAGGVPSSSFDVGDRVVGQVLRTLGVRRLDTLVLTHGDADHIGGARAIVNEFRPRDVWEGIPVPLSVPLADLRRAADAVNSRWIRVQRADDAFLGEVQLRVHHPRPPDWERQGVRNDDSIVLELLYRDVSVVFTGDIGMDVERDIAASFEPAKLRVLKVAHHGSLTSSSELFVNALRPDVAVFSVGRSNTFGHPARAIVERYESLGTQIYRTDQDGAVSLDTDGQTIHLTTYANDIKTTYVATEAQRH